VARNILRKYVSQLLIRIYYFERNPHEIRIARIFSCSPQILRVFFLILFSRRLSEWYFKIPLLFGSCWGVAVVSDCNQVCHDNRQHGGNQLSQMSSTFEGLSFHMRSVFISGYSFIPFIIFPSLYATFSVFSELLSNGSFIKFWWKVLKMQRQLIRYYKREGLEKGGKNLKSEKCEKGRESKG